MYNALFALLAGCLTFGVLAATKLLTPYEATVPAVIAAIVVFVVLARRTFSRLEAILRESSHFLQQRPPRIEPAMASMRRSIKRRLLLKTSVSPNHPAFDALLI